jgi:hypothetical protein
MNLKTMCNACKGAGGWGCGAEARRCEPCAGTGEVALCAAPETPAIDITKARRFLAKLPVDIDIDLRECSDYLKDALELVDLQTNRSPASWEAMYFAQCSVTDELRAKLEEGSDKTLKERIAELEANLATMNARYSTLQAASDKERVAVGGMA